MKITVIAPTELPSKLSLPVYSSRVPAGFPSPADDYIEEWLDLNEYLIKHPASTFFARASGNSMVNVGILDKALLIVDRSIEAQHDDIVIALIDGEMTCKILDTKARVLRAGNLDYKAIPIPEEVELIIVGVVVHVVNRLCMRS